MNRIFTFYSWLFDVNIGTPTSQNKIHCYLEENDTLDDVDIDDDVDTELEVETLKKKEKSIIIMQQKEKLRVFLLSCDHYNSTKSLTSTSILNERN